MNETSRVAVCSRSFSKNAVLRAELLERYAHVTFNDAGLELRGEALANFLRGHDKALIALERVDASILKQLPELCVIGKYGVGLDGIDLAALRDHDIRLGWTGGVNRRSVAELVIAFAISLLRHVPAANREVLSGTWRQHIGGTLSGRTVGVIGCGFVGKEVVRLLQPFGCQVLANDVRRFDAFYARYGVQAVDLDTVLHDADVVTLHVPLDDSTRGMLSDARLSLLRPSAVLINTARGHLVDESSLKRRLQRGDIAAAAFDVFAVEPPHDEELLHLSNFLATPHIGGSAAEAILAMGRAAINGLDDNYVPSPTRDLSGPEELE